MKQDKNAIRTGTVTASDLAEFLSQSTRTAYRELAHLKLLHDTTKIFWHHVYKYYDIELTK